MNDPRQAGTSMSSLLRAAEAARSSSRGPHRPPDDGLARLAQRVRRRRRQRYIGASAAGLVFAFATGALLWHAPLWNRAGDGAPRATAEMQGGEAPPVSYRAAPAPQAGDDDRRWEEATRVARVGDMTLFAERNAVWELALDGAIDLDRGAIFVGVRRPRVTSNDIVVRTADATVIAVGTRFAVLAADDQPTFVAVSAGAVRVTYSDREPVTVTRGHALEGPERAPRPLTEEEAARLAERLNDDALRWDGTLLGPGEEPARAAPKPDEDPPPTAPSTTREEQDAPASVARRRGQKPRVTCDMRYAVAEGALRAGRFDAAADELQAIAAHCPAAHHAGAALMDLGRIALGPLDEAPRALSAYDAYLARFPEGRFRQSAWAGRCLAAARCGLDEQARDCAAAYLSAHPDGVHADALRNLQGGRHDHH